MSWTAFIVGILLILLGIIMIFKTVRNVYLAYALILFAWLPFAVWSWTTGNAVWYPLLWFWVVGFVGFVVAGIALVLGRDWRGIIQCFGVWLLGVVVFVTYEGVTVWPWTPHHAAFKTCVELREEIHKEVRLYNRDWNEQLTAPDDSELERRLEIEIGNHDAAIKSLRAKFQGPRRECLPSTEPSVKFKAVAPYGGLHVEFQLTQAVGDDLSFEWILGDPNHTAHIVDGSRLQNGQVYRDGQEVFYWDYSQPGQYQPMVFVKDIYGSEAQWSTHVTVAPK